MCKVAVVGSRDFKHPDWVRAILNEYLPGMTFFISGGATGVDSIAEHWVDEYNEAIKSTSPEFTIKKVIFEADWDKYGKRAGAIRNQIIVDEADIVLIFWNGISKGTKITMDLAIDSRKTTIIYVKD